MRVHDWTKVSIDEFHDFHQCLTVMLSMQLNQGILPESHYSQIRRLDFGSGELILEEYHRRKNRVLIFDEIQRREVSKVELVYPDDKQTTKQLNVFVNRIAADLEQGLNLLVVDFFPSTSCVQGGIHEPICTRLSQFQSLSKEPRSLVAYTGGKTIRSQVEAIHIGADLAAMPLFITSEQFVNAPLSEAYAAAFQGFPRHLRRKLDQSHSQN